MKICIVSSYDDLCGNASYTKALEKELKKRNHEVEILDLKSNIFNSRIDGSSKLANDTINEFIEKIKKADYTNFQFEAVLYGAKAKVCLKRFSKLIHACKNGAFSVTLHRLDYTTQYMCTSLNSIVKTIQKKKKVSSIKKLIRKIKAYFLKPKFDNTNVVDHIIKMTAKKDGLIIVHTRREKDIIEKKYKNIFVVDHPICINSEEDIANIKTSLEKDDYRKKIGIPNNTKNIGIFGFVSAYKDFETAITSLTNLPQEYNLYIFGGQHPLSFSKNNSGDSYIHGLIDLAKTLNVDNRVHFMGAQETDEKMLKAMLICDYIVLPYLECGQSGSAVASMALEASKNVFLSRNACFNEFKKYTKESFFSFDMGNYKELTEKIVSLPDKEEIYTNRGNFLKTYNIKTNIDKYLSIFNKK